MLFQTVAAQLVLRGFAPDPQTIQRAIWRNQKAASRRKIGQPNADQITNYILLNS